MWFYYILCQKSVFFFNGIISFSVILYIHYYTISVQLCVKFYIELHNTIIYHHKFYILQNNAIQAQVGIIFVNLRNT